MCAKAAASAVRVIFDQFDLSGVLNSTQQKVDQETPVVTCFSDGGPRRLIGNYDVSHSDLGLMEVADDGYDEQMFAAINNTADHYLTKLFTGSAENSLSYDSVVRLSGQPRSAQLAGAVLLSFDSAGANGVARGLVLGSATVVNNDATPRTGRNQGVTTTGQIYAVIFRVLAFSGTNISLSIEESQNNGAGDPYATIAGLSQVFAGIGVSRKTTTAATEAWKRVAILGTYTSALILVTAGVVRGS